MLPSTTTDIKTVMEKFEISSPDDLKVVEDKKNGKNKVPSGVSYRLVDDLWNSPILHLLVQYYDGKDNFKAKPDKDEKQTEQSAMAKRNQAYDKFLGIIHKKWNAFIGHYATAFSEKLGNSSPDSSSSSSPTNYSPPNDLSLLLDIQILRRLCIHLNRNRRGLSTNTFRHLRLENNLIAFSLFEKMQEFLEEGRLKKSKPSHLKDKSFKGFRSLFDDDADYFELCEWFEDEHKNVESVQDAVRKYLFSGAAEERNAFIYELIEETPGIRFDRQVVYPKIIELAFRSFLAHPGDEESAKIKRDKFFFNQKIIFCTGCENTNAPAHFTFTINHEEESKIFWIVKDYCEKHSIDFSSLPFPIALLVWLGRRQNDAEGLKEVQVRLDKLKQDELNGKAAQAKPDEKQKGSPEKFRNKNVSAVHQTLHFFLEECSNFARPRQTDPQSPLNFKEEHFPLLLQHFHEILQSPDEATKFFVFLVCLQKVQQKSTKDKWNDKTRDLKVLLDQSEDAKQRNGIIFSESDWKKILAVYEKGMKGIIITKGRVVKHGGVVSLDELNEIEMFRQLKLYISCGLAYRHLPLEKRIEICDVIESRNSLVPCDPHNGSGLTLNQRIAMLFSNNNNNQDIQLHLQNEIFTQSWINNNNTHIADLIPLKAVQLAWKFCRQHFDLKKYSAERKASRPFLQWMLLRCSDFVGRRDLWQLYDRTVIAGTGKDPILTAKCVFSNRHSNLRCYVEKIHDSERNDTGERGFAPFMNSFTETTSKEGVVTFSYNKLVKDEKNETSKSKLDEWRRNNLVVPNTLGARLAKNDDRMNLIEQGQEITLWTRVPDSKTSTEKVQFPPFNRVTPQDIIFTAFPDQYPQEDHPRLQQSAQQLMNFFPPAEELQRCSNCKLPKSKHENKNVLRCPLCMEMWVGKCAGTTLNFRKQQSGTAVCKNCISKVISGGSTICFGCHCSIDGKKTGSHTKSDINVHNPLSDKYGCYECLGMWLDECVDSAFAGVAKEPIKDTRTRIILCKNCLHDNNNPKSVQEDAADGKNNNNEMESSTERVGLIPLGEDEEA